MIKEFKEFIMKGNVLDLAVAVIIGGAFGAIVSSFVDDVIMPPIGFLLGGVDFSDLKLILSAAGEGTEEVAVRYGIFLQRIIDFLIIALVIFIVIKAYNRISKKQEEEAPAPAGPTETDLLTEIRDLLKKQ